MRSELRRLVARWSRTNPAPIANMVPLNQQEQPTMTLTINETARRNHEWVEAMGWHNTPPASATRLALIASEIGEFANECRGDDGPTEHAVEELADIVLRCLDVMVGVRRRDSNRSASAIARYIVAPDCTDLPDHIADAICWTVAMREPAGKLYRGIKMPSGRLADEGPESLELAWGLYRTLHAATADRMDYVPAYGTVIRATMYTACRLSLPLDMAIVSKLERNEQGGNPKGRTV